MGPSRHWYFVLGSVFTLLQTMQISDAILDVDRHMLAFSNSKVFFLECFLVRLSCTHASMFDHLCFCAMVEPHLSFGDRVLPKN
jgi:hypothetical protein